MQGTEALPELKRAYSRFRLNPSRVRRIWDELDDTRRNDLVRTATGSDPTGHLLPIHGQVSAGDSPGRDGRAMLSEREATAGMRKLLERCIADAEHVCRWWAKVFGGIDRVNDERLRITLGLLIDQGYSADDLTWAARAYREYVNRDDWHRREMAAGRPCLKTFERFYYDERLNQWVMKGRDLANVFVKREAAVRTERGEREQRTENLRAADSLLARYRSLGGEEQQRLIHAAVEQLKAKTRGVLIGGPTMNNPLVRNLVLKAVQRITPATTSTPIGEAVNQSLGG